MSDTIKIFKGMKNISNLLTLSINHNIINDETVNELATILYHNTSLKSLYFSYNDLSSSNTIKIFQGMKDISKLQTIDISHNMITDEAAEAIATVLSHNNKLKSLDLSYNYFGCEGFAKVFGYSKNIKHLTRLSISNNIITIKAAESIATFMYQNSKLEELDLSNNFMQTAAAIKIFKHVVNMFSLRKMHIHNNMITDQAAEYIAMFLSQNTKLEDLDISCNNLQRDGAIKILLSIKSNLTLRKLNISQNLITDEAVKYIEDVMSGCKRLEELNMCCINIKVPIPFTNLNIKSLVKFDFSHNNIDEQTANEILLFLSCCVNLQILDLSYTNLQSAGGIRILSKLDVYGLTKFNISGNGLTKHTANNVATVLSKNGELEELDLSYNNLQEFGTINILDSINISNLRNLNISNNHITDNLNLIADILTHASKLVQLDLSYNELSSESIEYTLYKTKNIYTNLMQLNMSGIGIKGNVAAALAYALSQNTKLNVLNLSDNKLDTQEIRIIFNGLESQALIVLNISHNKITDQSADDIAAFLSKSTKMKELDLSYNNLRAPGAIKICKTNLLNLTKLNISHNSITAEAANDIATFLSQNTKLQVLNISFNNLQELGCKNIFQALKEGSHILSSLKIGHCKIINEAADELTNVLLNNTRLKELDLSYSNLLTSDATRIFDGIKNTLNLVAIYVRYIIITSEVADKLAASLIYNASLRELDLSYNKLLALLAIKIFRGLENTTSLEAIDISHNMITDEAAENIATVLSHNNKLQSLNLSSNYFRCEGFVKMFDGIKNDVCLKELNISSNEVTTKAAECIANLLSHNSKLEILDVSNNFLRAEDFIKIFKSMKIISNLKAICFGGNVISSEAADNIAGFLHQCIDLEEIDMSNCDLQTADAIKIFQAIKHVSTLIKLNVAHNTITDKATKYIVNILSNNKKLKEINLSYNNIVIYDFTECNFTNLQDLDLCYTNLQTAVGIEGLNAFSLKKCSISNNYLTAEVVDGIGALMSENDDLQELDLSCNNLQEVGTKAILDFLNISNLMKLNISNNNITNTSVYLIDILTHATNLVELDISYNRLTSDEIECFLYKCKNVIVTLIKLNLSGNEICNEAAAALENVLSDNTTLRELSLSNTNLKKEEINHLFNILCFPCLTKLSVSNNNITDESADYIATFLSKCNELEQLDLSHNHLTSAGAIKICKINLTNLNTFNLSFNNITAEAANDMATFLSQNLELQVLNLSNNDLQECSYSNTFRMVKVMSVLSILTVCNNTVISKTADELAAALCHNIFLKELDFSNNDLSTSNVISIFNGMKNINNLITLNVSHNRITDEAAEAIESVLSHNSKLQSLDLSYNYFMSEGFFRIFSRTRNIAYLQKLNICCNKITSRSADGIAVFLSHNLKLKELDLSNNFLQTTSAITIFKGLKEISTLKKVYFHKNEITWKAADSIAVFLIQCTKLKEFDISYNNLQTIGAIKIFAGLKCTTNLETFNIAHNMITDEAIEYIVNVLFYNTKLKELNMSYNNLTSSGAPKLVNLTKFDFSHNNFNKGTAEQMKRFLSHCVYLQELDLSNTNLQSAGVLKLFYRLNVSSLTKLSICGNLIPSHSAARIGSFLSNNKQLKELDISRNDLQESGIITILNSMCISNLTKLNIGSNNITTSLLNIAHLLTNATELVEIDLSYNNFDDSFFIPYSLSRNIFENVEILILSGIISGNESAAIALADTFQGNRKLKELNVSNNHLHAQLINKIFSMLQVSTLIKLNISHNNITDQATDNLAIFLSRNTELEELDLSHNILTASGAIKIFNVNILRLKKINISHNNITAKAADNIQAFLCRNTKLEELDLSHNHLRDTGAIKICKSKLLKLCKFNISHNYISVKATNDVVGFLSNSIRLQALDLSYNDLQESGCRSIFKGLKHACIMSSLKLSNNSVTNEAIAELVTVLLCNTSLQELDLSGNDLSAYDTKMIFNAMENISTLLTININHNMITDEAAYSIANVLHHNHNLQTFDISFNCFTSYGCIIIFRRMKKMLHLKNLSIAYNKITAEATSSIVSILSKNTKLEKLDVSYNYLQASGTVMILQSIKNNLALIKLNIAHNMITDEATEHVFDILSINGTLKELNLCHNGSLETNIITEAMAVSTTKMLGE